MRHTLAGAVLSALLLTGCVRSSLEVSRFTCQDDDDCDKGGGEACRGIAAEVDDQCDDKRNSSGPYYLIEPDLMTCLIFYCIKKTTGLTCGGVNCLEGRTCYAFKNDNSDVELQCADRATLDGAATCSGLADEDSCTGGRCVRFIELERESTGDNPTYRCLPAS